VFITRKGFPYRKKNLEHFWDKGSELATKKYQAQKINLYDGLRHSLASQRLNEGFSIGEVKKL
jgi:hypothetical protein